MDLSLKFPFAGIVWTSPLMTWWMWLATPATQATSSRRVLLPLQLHGADMAAITNTSNIININSNNNSNNNHSNNTTHPRPFKLSFHTQETLRWWGISRRQTPGWFPSSHLDPPPCQTGLTFASWRPTPTPTTISRPARRTSSPPPPPPPPPSTTAARTEPCYLHR